jgi:hypothetical protein
LWRPERANDGGLGREFDDRAIVERHFGKHTGLQHSAKACPQMACWRWKPATRLVEAGIGEVQID